MSGSKKILKSCNAVKPRVFPLPATASMVSAKAWFSGGSVANMIEVSSEGVVPISKHNVLE